MIPVHARWPDRGCVGSSVLDGFRSAVNPPPPIPGERVYPLWTANVSAGQNARPRPTPGGPGTRIPGPYMLRSSLEQVFAGWSHILHTPITFYWFSLLEQQERHPQRVVASTRCVPPNHLDSLRRAHLLPQGRPPQRPPGRGPRRVSALERADPLGRPDRRVLGRAAGRAGGDRHGAVGAREAAGRRARAGPRRRSGPPAARHRAPPAGAAGRARIRRRPGAADAGVRRQPLLAAHLRPRRLPAAPGGRSRPHLRRRSRHVPAGRAARPARRLAATTRARS